MEFQVMDVVFGVVILLLALRCLIQGVIREVFSVAQWVLGLAAAFLLYRRGGAWIAGNWLPDQPFVPYLIAFAGIFILVFVLVLVLERVLKDIVSGLRLGGVDRILGAVFGLFEGFLLVSLVIWGLRIQPLFDASFLIEGSFFAELLAPLVGSVEKTVTGAAGAIRG